MLKTLVFYQGMLLEKQGTVNYSQKRRSEIIIDITEKSGLKPVLDWRGGSFDDVIDYSSGGDTADEGSSNSDVGTVTGAGKPSAGTKREPTLDYNKWYKSTVKNHCPNCGKDRKIMWLQGKDINHCSPKTPDSAVEGLYLCCVKLGG